MLRDGHSGLGAISKKGANIGLFFSTNDFLSNYLHFWPPFCHKTSHLVREMPTKWLLNDS